MSQLQKEFLRMAMKYGCRPVLVQLKVGLIQFTNISKVLFKLVEYTVFIV